MSLFLAKNQDRVKYAADGHGHSGDPFAPENAGKVNLDELELQAQAKSQRPRPAQLKADQPRTGQRLSRRPSPVPPSQPQAAARQDRPSQSQAVARQARPSQPQKRPSRPQEQSGKAKQANQPRRQVRVNSNENEVMAILTDQRNGKEYYVAIMDSFIYSGKEYSVMYNYELDSAEHIDPEIVIMRTYRDTDGEQYFTSVRDKNEMDMVFEIFYERYIRSLKK